MIYALLILPHIDYIFAIIDAAFTLISVSHGRPPEAAAADAAIAINTLL